MSKLARVYDRSRVPLYLQVASVMRQRIEVGHWDPGQKISTLEELEREFEVARVVVNLHLARDVFDRAPAEFRKHPALHVLASVDRPQIKRAHQTLVIGGA